MLELAEVLMDETRALFAALPWLGILFVAVGFVVWLAWFFYGLMRDNNGR